MNKAEFIGKIGVKTGMSKKDIQTVVDAGLDVCKEAMASKDSVSITGFGTLKVSHRNARQSKNPRTGEAVTVPAHDVPAFKPGKLLKDAVQG